MDRPVSQQCRERHMSDPDAFLVLETQRYFEGLKGKHNLELHRLEMHVTKTSETLSLRQEACRTGAKVKLGLEYLLSSFTPWGRSIVTLKGPPLLLDHALSDILQYFPFGFFILDAQTWKPRVRRNHSKSAKDWNDFWRIQGMKLFTDPRINRYLSRADRAFLKWNNDLKAVLIRPLTDCMVNGCTLDYIDIMTKTQNINETVITYFEDLQSVIYKFSNEYMEEELIN
ncbi:hypothetical protein BCON_0007g01040 [Botryotinia convoluta]|uniref:Uncharacterized protein n=1 Tax=Botryotinia convoluta TaxID=54673 RepID=A0A4Z1IUT1_9HELO|nr:hypothetical protein BCON_0007g01040 [Botryotinia convoluta]